MREGGGRRGETEEESAERDVDEDVEGDDGEEVADHGCARWDRCWMVIGSRGWRSAGVVVGGPGWRVRVGCSARPVKLLCDP